MMGYQREREERLEEMQNQAYQQQLAKDREECTFNPNMQDRNGVKGPAPNKFYKDGEQFLKKKQYYIDEQNAAMEKEIQK